MAEWLSSDISINGTILHYYRTGGNLPPVVLAHGLTDNALCWRRVVRALKPNYDVIFYDARGHGQSAAPATGYTPAERAADLASLIETLGLDPVRVIGHSLGAEAALWLLAHYPHLVQCAVLEDPPWRSDWEEQSPLERAAMQESWRTTLVDRQTRSFEALVAFCRERSPAWADEDCADWAHGKFTTNLRALASVGAERPPWGSLIERIHRPTLLVTGDPTCGALVTPELAREATTLGPCLEVLHLAGAGHNIRRDCFVPYLAGVADFLARNG